MKSRTLRMVILFLAAFGVYLWTMPPSLPAYRDAGEMATSAFTLGVSHPPSYPLYILIGHAAQELPLGSPAWRLTVFSALASAGVVASLFEIVLAVSGFLPAVGAAVLAATNTIFWSVAVVPEMYSFMLLLGLALIAIAFRLQKNYDRRLWYVVAFLYGLFIGNRADLVLWAPGLLVLALFPDQVKVESRRFWSWSLTTLLFALMGFSIYLYLPFRSMQGPWLDWNHPAELSRLIGSLTRRGYGGTLDLLSQSYAPGANFIDNLRIYGLHLWRDYLGVAVILAAAGFVSWYRRDRWTWLGLSLMYLGSGPYFLYKANMPPNPHALAIVDPHYLLSDMIVTFWVAEGLSTLCNFLSKFGEASLSIQRSLAPKTAFGTAAAGKGRTSLPAVLGGYVPPGVLADVCEGVQNADRSRVSGWIGMLLIAFGPYLFGQGFLGRGEIWSRVNRRWTLFDYDYCHNMMRSLPPDAVVIAKKDVQLFSLWYFQTVEHLRPDVHLIAQGLSASPWYQESRRKQGETAYIGPLRDASDWRQFAALNGPKTYTTPDADIPGDLELGPPRGLAIDLSTAASANDLLWNFIVKRGDFHYERQPDFFDSDIIDTYSSSQQRLGNYYLRQKQWDRTKHHLNLGWSMRWLYPDAPALLAYVDFTLGSMPEALSHYQSAVRLFEETRRLAAEYRALESVVGSIKHGQADAQINCGVVLEKLGQKEKAEELYRSAIELDPNFAQAHFNLAVLYWNRDWGVVANEMAETLRIDPSRRDAARYLNAARAHQQMSIPTRSER